MKTIILSLLALLASFAPLAVVADSPPNIVFIIADDLGWADVEFHGGNTPTPNLNRLLAEGVELRQHYVAPVCSPTRAGFLTGRYWSRFGITTPINNRGLSFDTVTVPRALSGAGYVSALVGKWHLGSKPEWGPEHFGFDHSYGSLAGGVAPYNHRYKKGEYSVTWHRNHELIEERGHVTDLLTDEAVRWIADTSSAQQAKPFFLYLPFTAVHLPIREPEKWLAAVPENIEGEVARHYSACILHLDSAVGRIVAAVEKAGLTDNTLLVFTSDNGGSTAENNDTKYPDDNCPNGRLPGNNLPLSGKKGTLYEGGIRVPTIARWPGKLQAGGHFDAPVCVVDWMPTFCALGGVDIDAGKLQLDGVNLWPALTGKGELPERHLHLAGTRNSWAIREGDWKLIFTELKDGDQRVELFDLASDPTESHNLSVELPERVQRLTEVLHSERKKDRATRGGI